LTNLLYRGLKSISFLLGFDRQRLSNSNEKGKSAQTRKRKVAMRPRQIVTALSPDRVPVQVY
jgi:hypothetical protein